MRSVSLTSAVEVQDIIHPFLRPLRSPVDARGTNAAFFKGERFGMAAATGQQQPILILFRTLIENYALQNRDRVLEPWKPTNSII
jgi:hypothetical protein